MSFEEVSSLMRLRAPERNPLFQVRKLPSSNFRVEEEITENILNSEGFIDCAMTPGVFMTAWLARISDQTLEPEN